MSVKIYCLFLFIIFHLEKEYLYLWLLLRARVRSGTARIDDYRDKSKDRIQRAKEIDDSVLRELVGDSYYNMARKDIHKVESIVHQSIFDIFDDNPVFSKFPHLRGLARNREFEKMYYGKVRGE
ncbi:MAG: hypothetical protein LBD94_02190 [Rickettsiales bacterium]|jgi:hypothetical protein|nr:hypothetical protein [Rickettsiales bacterium]